MVNAVGRNFGSQEQVKPLMGETATPMPLTRESIAHKLPAKEIFGNTKAKHLLDINRFLAKSPL